jgi:hypothetical protein
MDRHHLHLPLSFAKGDGVKILRNRLTARLGINRADTGLPGIAYFIFSLFFFDYQRIYTLAGTITYKYVDVNGNFSALLFPAGGNNFCAGVIRAKEFVSKVLR